MAKEKTVDDMYREIVEWEKARDNLNKEIASVEASTRNVIEWIKTNKADLQKDYFTFQQAVYNSDEQAFLDTMENAGTRMCLLIKMPMEDGSSIFDTVKQKFGEDSEAFKRLQEIDEDFPADLIVTAEKTDEEEKEEELEENIETLVEKNVKKNWWQSKTAFEKEKQKFLEEQIQTVRSEVVGIRTEQPFYIDSFFEWVEATREAREDVPGNGEYSDFLAETYRNPDYILTQVYNDSNEAIQTVYEDVYSEVEKYFAVKVGFVRENVDVITTNLQKYKNENEVIRQILEDEQQISLNLWVLNSFSDVNSKTKALKTILSYIPLDLIQGRDTGEDLISEKEIFDEFFNMVIKGTLETDAITIIGNTVKEILDEDKGKEVIENITNDMPVYAKKILELSSSNPAKAKATMQKLFRVVGCNANNETVSLFIDLHTAIENKDTRQVKSLFSNASDKELEQWLFIRDLFNISNDNIVREISTIAKTKEGETSLFATLTEAGLPILDVNSKNKFAFMQIFLNKTISDINFASSKTEKNASFRIFETIVDFVAENTSAEEYSRLLSERRDFGFSNSITSPSILEEVVSCEDELKEKLLKKLFSKIKTNIEIADTLYNASQSSKNNSVAQELHNMSDELVGDNIVLEETGSKTVIFPNKLSHAYHGYDALGYMAKTHRDQSETYISEKDTRTYVNILGSRQDAIVIGDELIYPDKFDIVLYDVEANEVEFIKSSKERISFPLTNEDAKEDTSDLKGRLEKLKQENQAENDNNETLDIMGRIAEICSDHVSLKTSNILVKPSSFETIRYDENTKELILNQEIVIQNVAQAEFAEILDKITAKNKSAIYIEEAGLLINVDVVDAIQTREVVDYFDDEASKFSITEILINGRSIDVISLLKQQEFTLDSDIDEDFAYISNLASIVVERLKENTVFEEVLDAVHVNTNNIAIVRAEEPNILTITSFDNRYIQEYETKEATEWLNVSVIKSSPFIERKDGIYIFDVMDERIEIAETSVSDKLISKKHKKILEEFYCNLDDICEVSVNSKENSIAIKTPKSSVALELGGDFASKGQKIIRNLDLDSKRKRKTKAKTKIKPLLRDSKITELFDMYSMIQEEIAMAGEEIIQNTSRSKNEANTKTGKILDYFKTDEDKKTDKRKLIDAINSFVVKDGLDMSYDLLSSLISKNKI